MLAVNFDASAFHHLSLVVSRTVSVKSGDKVTFEWYHDRCVNSVEQNISINYINFLVPQPSRRHHRLISQRTRYVAHPLDPRSPDHIRNDIDPLVLFKTQSWCTSHLPLPTALELCGPSSSTQETAANGQLTSSSAHGANTAS